MNTTILRSLVVVSLLMWSNLPQKTMASSPLFNDEQEEQFELDLHCITYNQILAQKRSALTNAYENIERLKKSHEKSTLTVFEQIKSDIALFNSFRPSGYEKHLDDCITSLTQRSEIYREIYSGYNSALPYQERLRNNMDAFKQFLELFLVALPEEGEGITKQLAPVPYNLMRLEVKRFKDWTACINAQDLVNKDREKAENLRKREEMLHAELQEFDKKEKFLEAHEAAIKALNSEIPKSEAKAAEEPKGEVTPVLRTKLGRSLNSWGIPASLIQSVGRGLGYEYTQPAEGLNEIIDLVSDTTEGSSSESSSNE